MEWMTNRVQVEDDPLASYLHPADELRRRACHSREPEPAEHGHVQDGHPRTRDQLIVLQPAGRSGVFTQCLMSPLLKKLTTSTSCK